MKRNWLLPAALIVALVQIAVLASMIAGRTAILRNGQDVVLEVQPVDPRDLLRGDYVTLGYNISSLSRDIFTSPENGIEGEHWVFVRLQEGENGIWQPVAARLDTPFEDETPAGQVMIKGMMTDAWRDQERLSVVYGIERFYLPEGQGRQIEADMRQREFRMRVAVAADGTPQIKAFLDGGTMLYEEPLY
ncbi:GDYXXLXY domain-containing protein [Aquamicrobium sp. LC103]|uniref:GDYXXLXY domain-containing protein n=1 Tax=Aquamicrobium sp. LC103 TaxID=1120658 RepID=UPI00063E80B2|nr:GDYXXLXY domain-containing protein [Aquamicrobium sp. LC103]TKT76785.1 hypothetical protein XW59_015065 [Aquamicrobium sp. LC103]